MPAAMRPAHSLDRLPARRNRVGTRACGSRPGSARAARPGLWATLGLLLWAFMASAVLPTSAAAQAIRVATAFEVCGSFGARKVDAHGEPVSAQDAHHHDCCITPPLCAPPSSALHAVTRLDAVAPAARLTAARLGSEWLAPLSRGPPARG